MHQTASAILVLESGGMTMELEGSKTYQNILNTIDGEMKASTKYVIYGDKAREDGYENIGSIFDETSHNEREHAERMMKIIHNGEIPDTLDNLKDASGGENHEWTKMYQEYAEIARKEGFDQIAELFLDIAEVERHHDFRYKNLVENIEKRQVFCKGEKILWICMNCGYLYFGECAPEFCPLCGYPQSYFKPNCEDY